MARNTSKIKLKCDVTSEMKEQILQLGDDMFWGKGSLSKAYRHLMSLAFSNPAFPIRAFEGDSSESCTYDCNILEASQLQAYAQSKELSIFDKRPRTRSAAFSDAIWRGLSIHLTKAPQSVSRPRSDGRNVSER